MSHARSALKILVPGEPFPQGPIGMSARIKLESWLEIARLLSPEFALHVLPPDELNGEPDLVEAFTIHSNKLSNITFPTLEEHNQADHISRYWTSVEKSSIPAIPVLDSHEAENNFPLFVRRETSALGPQSIVNDKAGLNKLRALYDDLVLRPLVKIEKPSSASRVTFELRAHVVHGCAIAIESLFPAWASQRPTPDDLEKADAWLSRRWKTARDRAERIAGNLHNRWFVADFAEVDSELLLVELNPGWCSGIAHTSVADAVHRWILKLEYGIEVPIESHPEQGVRLAKE